LTWDRLTGENQTKIQLHVYCLYTWERPRKTLTHWDGGSRHLKCHLQPKTKDDVGGGESVMGGYQEKHRKQE